jgi:hypothetical protein
MFIIYFNRLILLPYSFLFFIFYLFSLLIFRRKREARQVHKTAHIAKKLSGFRAKLFHKKRHSEKVAMKKQ